MIKNKKKASYKNIINIILLIAVFTLVSCEFTEKSMDCKDRKLPFGIGVLVCIIFIAIGIASCVIGQATPLPGVFILIGIVLPLLVFVICIAWPIKSKNENKIKIERNIYIVERWMYFTFMLLFLLGLLFPLILMFLETLIPQRVDSRAQKEADEKYYQMLRERAGLKSEKEHEYLGAPIVGGRPYQNPLYPENPAPNYQGGQYQAGQYGSQQGQYQQGYNPQNNYGNNDYGNVPNNNFQNSNVYNPQSQEDSNRQMASGFVRKKKKRQMGES